MRGELVGKGGEIVGAKEVGDGALYSPFVERIGVMEGVAMISMPCEALFSH